MGLLVAFVGICLLIAGLIGVWQGNWRVMWGAQAFMAMFVIGCLTVDQWYHLAGINRGDGFVLIGIVMVGLIAAGVSVGALTIAGFIQLFRGGRGASAQTQGKSEAA